MSTTAIKTVEHHPPATHNGTPMLEGAHTYGSITDKIGDIILTRSAPKQWYIAFLIGFTLLNVLGFAVAYLLLRGVGIWGINIPVGWGFAIVNFVWWIGIGHAGTLISAILLLFRQRWRTSINRAAEAMTLFAVACAGAFPLLHMGRPWFAFYLFPYPATSGLMPNWLSPLVWDVFAVSTYATVSLLFWYTGLVPDLATLRDKTKNQYLRMVFGVLALGWTGAAKHWQRYEIAYLLLAGLSTPLVLSVHTVVSFDFAIAIVPGWHTTIFPPYFVAGAIYAGFAMVITLMVPIRKIYHLEDMITLKHLENMGKVMLATGLLVAYGYGIEVFMNWYSANPFEEYVTTNRMTGPYKEIYWSLWICNIFAPQALWIKSVRTSPLGLFIVAMFINFGMWLERYVIVVLSLSRDFLPSSWGRYSGTIWDWATFLGTIGLFTTLMMLFIRTLPMIAISEMKMMLPGAKVHEEKL